MIYQKNKDDRVVLGLCIVWWCETISDQVGKVCVLTSVVGIDNVFDVGVLSEFADGDTRCIKSWCAPDLRRETARDIYPAMTQEIEI